MSQERAFLLGVDAGTSVVKAALFDRAGRELSAAARRTTLKSPHPAWVEVSMAETWTVTAEAIRALLAQSGVRAEQIAAVGLAGNMVGAWLIDARGQPVRDAILWADGRAQPVIERLSRDHPGFMARIFDSNGCVLQQGCTLPVLRWLAEHEPESLARAAWVLCCKDWLCFKLTGTIQIDHTEASGMPGDARTCGYSDAMLDLFEVRDLVRLFPPIRPSTEVVGAVLPAAAAETGLAVGTPVVLGAGDVPASALGVGAYAPGVACALLGTNFLDCVVTAAPMFEPRDVGLLFCLPGERWLRAMHNVSGTASLDWAIDQFCQPERAAASGPADLYARVEALAQTSEPGARGVIYLPYLSAQGITTPYAEPAARAEFFGLTNDHTRADLLRAVYEGMACAVREAYEAIPLPVHEIRASGGGAKSAFFCQLLADVTGKRVAVPAGSEYGARGAAILAAVGIGWSATLADALALDDAAATVYESRPALKRRYDEVFATYAALRDALRPIWRQAALLTR